MVKQFAANVLLFTVRRKDGEAAFDRFLAEQRAQELLTTSVLEAFLHILTLSQAKAKELA